LVRPVHRRPTAPDKPAQADLDLKAAWRALQGAANALGQSGELRYEIIDLMDGVERVRALVKSRGAKSHLPRRPIDE